MHITGYTSSSITLEVALKFAMHDHIILKEEKGLNPVVYKIEFNSSQGFRKLER